MLGRSVPGTLFTAAAVAVFVYGGQQIIAGQMTMGTLVAFMTLHGGLLSPVQSLLGLSASLSSVRVSLARVLELLDTRIEVTERLDARVCEHREKRSLDDVLSVLMDEEETLVS